MCSAVNGGWKLSRYLRGLLMSHWRQRLLEQRPNFLVIRLRRQNTVPIQDATRVGVHNEDGMIPGVEQDRVCGFGADTVQAEQFLAKLAGRSREQMIQRAAICRVEEGNERFEPLRFL